MSQRVREREGVDTALALGQCASCELGRLRSLHEASNSSLANGPANRVAQPAARSTSNGAGPMKTSRSYLGSNATGAHCSRPIRRRPIRRQGGRSANRASELNELDDTRAQYQLSGADIARSHTSIALARDGQLKGIIIGADLKPHWTAAMAMAMAVAETAHKQHHASISLASRSW